MFKSSHLHSWARGVTLCLSFVAASLTPTAQEPALDVDAAIEKHQP